LSFFYYAEKGFVRFPHCVFGLFLLALVIVRSDPPLLPTEDYGLVFPSGFGSFAERSSLCTDQGSIPSGEAADLKKEKMESLPGFIRERVSWTFYLFNFCLAWSY